jgi:hypothetical protein
MDVDYQCADLLFLDNTCFSYSTGSLAVICKFFVFWLVTLLHALEYKSSLLKNSTTDACL